MSWVKMDADLFMCHWAGYYLSAQRFDDGWQWITLDSFNGTRQTGKVDDLEPRRATRKVR